MLNEKPTEEEKMSGVFIYPCGAPESVMQDHSNKLDFIISKMEKLLESADYVTYMNGFDGLTETRVPKEKYFTEIWRRTNDSVTKEQFTELEGKVSAKGIFNAVSSISQKLIPILTLAGILFLALFGYFVFRIEKELGILEHPVKIEQQK